MLEGLRGEITISELCRQDGINRNSSYKWFKEFLEASKQRLAGNTTRQANSDEVKVMRKELGQMKLMVAKLSLNNRVLKKSLLGLENPLDD